jgi:hypothetical protein
MRREETVSLHLLSGPDRDGRSRYLIRYMDDRGFLVAAPFTGMESELDWILRVNGFRPPGLAVVPAAKPGIITADEAKRVAITAGICFALVLLAALLAGCGGYPDRLTQQGWTLDARSLPAPDGWQEALDGVRERAPCLVPEEVWGGVVTVTAEGYGRSADLPTWWPGDVPRIGVAVEAGLPGLVHVACHVAQMVCGVDPYQHDGAFVACVGGRP